MLFKTGRQLIGVITKEEVGDKTSYSNKDMDRVVELA
jgi:hypothetical protein